MLKNQSTKRQGQTKPHKDEDMKTTLDTGLDLATYLLLLLLLLLLPVLLVVHLEV